MASITSGGVAKNFEILRADLTMQTGRESLKPLGVSKVIGKPGVNRGLGGTLEFLAETWAGALWLLGALSADFLLTENTLGMNLVSFTPVGEPKAAAQPIPGIPACWIVQIEVTRA